MALGAAGAAAFVTRPWLSDARALAWQAAQSAEPELIVFNARVYTMDPATPRAEAVAIAGGRFVAVGTTAAVRGRGGKGAQLIDAKQMTIVPGFTDTHNHAGGTTLLYEVLVGNPFEVEFVTIASIIEKLRAKAQQTPPGMWVEGFFHDDTKLKDKRPLNTRDLDQVSKEHPVVVQHRGGHTSFYNSRAFELAGITKNTPNPEGGTFDKDATGELNGRVTDRARNAMGRAGRRPTFTAGAVGAAHARRARAHFERVRALRPDQRSPSGRRPCGDPRSRARGELRHRVSYEASGGSVEFDVRRRHQDRRRRRLDQVRRNVRAHRRWLVFGADDGDERAV
jgi:hypothetical protein